MGGVLAAPVLPTINLSILCFVLGRMMGSTTSLEEERCNPTPAPPEKSTPSTLEGGRNPEKQQQRLTQQPLSRYTKTSSLDGVTRTMMVILLTMCILPGYAEEARRRRISYFCAGCCNTGAVRRHPRGDHPRTIHFGLLKINNAHTQS